LSEEVAAFHKPRKPAYDNTQPTFIRHSNSCRNTSPC